MTIAEHDGKPEPALANTVGTHHTVDVFRSYVVRMHRTLEAYCQSGDSRRVFQQTYVTFSERILEALEQGRFADSAWATDMCCRFVELYFGHQEAYDTGRPDQCDVWRRSFDMTRSSQANVLQAMLLGMNAHINYDLALCSYGTARQFGELDGQGTGKPLDPKRYYDFLVINDVAWDNIEVVQHAVLRRFAPWLDWGNRLSLNFTKYGGEQILCVHRDKAWARARLLMRTSGPQEFDAIRGLIDAVACRNIDLISVVSLNPIRAYQRLRRWRAQKRVAVSTGAANLLQDMYIRSRPADDLVLETLIDTDGNLSQLVERCVTTGDFLKVRRVFELVSRRGDDTQVASLTTFLHAEDRKVRLAARSLVGRLRHWVPSPIDRANLEKQIQCDVDEVKRLSGIAHHLRLRNTAIELQGALAEEVGKIGAHVQELRGLCGESANSSHQEHRELIGWVAEDEIQDLMNHPSLWMRLCALLAAGQLGCATLEPTLRTIAVNGGDAERETAEFVLETYFSGTSFHGRSSSLPDSANGSTR